MSRSQLLLVKHLSLPRRLLQRPLRQLLLRLLMQARLPEPLLPDGQLAQQDSLMCRLQQSLRLLILE